MASDTTQKLAVLIDADNAMPSTARLLLAEVAKYGTANVKRAYGNWTSTNLSGWKKELLTHSIQPIQQFAYTNGKNATDSAMIIDAMDLLHMGRFDGFCLVSSDSDFTRLAARIRESGSIVYGFGEQKTPKPFIAACDKFIMTENLVYHKELVPHPDRIIMPKNHAPVQHADEDKDLVNLLRTTIETASDDHGWAELSRIGNLLTKKSPDFDSRTYRYSKLSDLISALPQFEVIRHAPWEGKPKGIYVHDKRLRRKNSSD
ncbi:uncharacterized protein N7469_005883 [Penicillium citrinum]|uniref:HTH OST-type domain-containing protein n=1 Tax=Penicillium citrinum TaxID=5077 RepID=A0A9W9TLX1_PENCI|nr:uncharacterized protein N7469_005883 [Penicillium citrinum]KAJ5231295.1 hypothetical protein N7469_005883 [Penicillium citrinum]KAK5787477.1 hypothetical protein VI817_009974 [Penicillium citrinum]